jgi:hypothetical protein
VVRERRSNCCHGSGVWASEQAATPSPKMHASAGSDGRRAGTAARTRTATIVSSASVKDHVVNVAIRLCGCERPT